MQVKIPAVRRTDSLYPNLGGKSGLEAMADEFCLRMTEGPELAPFFARAHEQDLIAQQVRFLVSALGGPEECSGSPFRPFHRWLLAQDSMYSRAGKHWNASLRAARPQTSGGRHICWRWSPVGLDPFRRI